VLTHALARDVAAVALLVDVNAALAGRRVADLHVHAYAVRELGELHFTIELHALDGLEAPFGRALGLLGRTLHDVVSRVVASGRPAGHHFAAGLVVDRWRVVLAGARVGDGACSRSRQRWLSLLGRGHGRGIRLFGRDRGGREVADVL